MNCTNKMNIKKQILLATMAVGLTLNLAGQSITPLTNETYSNVRIGNVVNLEIQLSSDPSSSGLDYVWYEITSPDGNTDTMDGFTNERTLDNRYVINWIAPSEGEWRFRAVLGSSNKNTIVNRASEEIVINVSGNAITLLTNESWSNFRAGMLLNLEAQTIGNTEGYNKEVVWLITDSEDRDSLTDDDVTASIDNRYELPWRFTEDKPYRIQALLTNANNSVIYARSEVLTLNPDGGVLHLVSPTQVNLQADETTTVEMHLIEPERVIGSAFDAWFQVTDPNGKVIETSDATRNGENRFTFNYTAETSGVHYFKGLIGNTVRSSVWAETDGTANIVVNPMPPIQGWYYDAQMNSWNFTADYYYPFIFRADDNAVLYFFRDEQGLAFFNFNTNETERPGE